MEPHLPQTTSEAVQSARRVQQKLSKEQDLKDEVA